ncbi:MAG: apolipoprotein N-acyltransferase [Elusimicrobia bacterium GWA2_61_42]|nr:MAG: apolipoprotein N-acyltransferase [Elusimicrobia bacterium GWA2_61_42]OGR79843.1 MAG: apolipoprotein N-acyltransferase [Elusimicrobia bacterium GWC2_61_25]
MLKKIPPFIFPLFTSLLLVLSYPKFSQGWLAWFALAPLCYHLLRAKTLKAAAGGGLGCGFIFYLGILYWIYPTMRAGGVEPAVSALGLAALSLILSLEFLVISVYGFYLKRAGLKVWPYLFALGWFLLEYGKVYLSFKAVWFPWFMLGYTQWAYTPLIQAASVAGVYGLGAAVCFSGALAGTLFVLKAPAYQKALRFAPVLLVFAGLWLFGRQELKQAQNLAPIRTLKVALLQPAIDLYAKWEEAEAENIKRTMESLSAAGRGADLAVWPENALPCWVDEPDCGAWLRSAVLAGGASHSFVGSVSKGGGRHVSAFLLDGKGEILFSYDKRQLVPFGEYVPLRDFLGKYIQPVAALGEFLPGEPRQKLAELGDLKIGAAICYESVFPYLFTGDTLAGAELFVNITNDGWYLDTAAPHQHFIANIFRAVENRRTVLRAANNGISGVIDPWGRVLAKTALNEKTVLAVTAPVYADQAFFPLYGHWFAWAALIIVSAFLLALLFI